MTNKRSTVWLAVTAAIGLTACGSGNSAIGRVSEKLGQANGGCTVDGHDYRPGDHFLDAQACNTCSCIEGGQVACTEMACVDGGHAPGNPNPPVPEACSNGPVYGPGTDLPFIKNPPTDNLQACVLHCGTPVYRRFGNIPTFASLPSGACSTEGEACQLNAEYSCACDAGQTSNGPVNDYICRCASGTWQCGVAYAGASICQCF